ncbi:MAG: bifunctional phosphoribosylaminoimidazolecarboxamide formyltransferase/IMP cyclohydrolase [Trueperella sp.]|nr:bifunctional phosphoribosylaminoimidazolecarboxamide formyltransferase/IMP cyclohydrolase [Trueperella sp.]
MPSPHQEVPLARHALISVSDKSGITDLAAALAQAGYELISTGSTASVIESAGIPVTPVEHVTGFPESFDGRVKTLHPKIHGGILARRDIHSDQMAELGVEPIDIVVVNLYPFSETVAAGGSFAEAIEQIDIGGPAMVRAAAKNHRDVAVVTDPSQYEQVVAALADGLTPEFRRELAAAAFALTARYDAAVSDWFDQAGTSVAEDSSDARANATAQAPESARLPESVNTEWSKLADLRYGENPHQAAALYGDGSHAGLAYGELLGGKAMSFNNYQDTEAAIRAVYDHGDPAVAVVKHANPCGVAIGEDIRQAHERAHACDPLSAYGGVVAANRAVTKDFAEQLAPIFTEVIVAPGFDEDALEVLRTKKNLRIVKVDPELPERDVVPISGGAVIQGRDELVPERDSMAGWELAAGQEADAATRTELEFAWRAVRGVKSNAILLADRGATVGIGMGQVNRVDSCRLAVERANTLAQGVERARGSVAASDAFFPFADGLQVLIDAGVRAVVQPGGSIRDDEVIAAAKAAGITMYFTHTRHFAH